MPSASQNLDTYYLRWYQKFETSYSFNYQKDTRLGGRNDVDTSNPGCGASGANYGAQNTVPYSGGISYHIRQEVDLNTYTYDVFVTPAGGAEVVLGSNYAFRNGTETVTQLIHRTVKTVTCDLVVSNFQISTTTTGGSEKHKHLKAREFICQW